MSKKYKREEQIRWLEYKVIKDIEKCGRSPKNPTKHDKQKSQTAGRKP